MTIESAHDKLMSVIDADRIEPLQAAIEVERLRQDWRPNNVRIVLLAESHVCLHTWPEQRAVTVDVYVCNFGADHSAKARGLMAALVERFQPEWTEQRSLDRGDGE